MLERFAVAWISRFGVENQPRWFVQWLQKLRSKHAERIFIEQVMSAQKTSIGLTSVWAEPHTTPDEIIEWLDAQIGDAKDNIPLALCLFGVWVIPATEADWAANSVPDETLATWMGQKDAWYHSGRSEIRNKLPETHDGLYIVINDGSVYVAKVLHPDEII